MKKIFTLLLVILGCVGQAMAARTIYVQNTKDYANLCVHKFGSSTQAETTWPGTYLRKDGTDKVDTETINHQTNDNEKFYTVDLSDYTTFIINNGSDNRQTTNLSASNYADGTYYYISETGDHGIELISLTVYSYTINVTLGTGWSTCKVDYWNANGGTGFPGDIITENSATSGTYKFKAYTNEVNILFNCGDNTAQTCNMTAKAGVNNYNIPSAYWGDNAWGEYVKTNSYGYATYVSTKNLSMPANTAYYARDKGNGCAEAIATTYPPGGTAMLIKGSANTTYHFGTRGAASNVPLTCTNAFHSGSDGAVTSWDDEATGPFRYILQGDMFKAAAGMTVAANKAYLQLSTAALARPLVFPEDDDTGIDAIMNTSEKSNAYYNLSGQRIANPTKGLYITNGKKVVIR